MKEKQSLFFCNRQISCKNTILNKYKRSKQTCHILHHVPYLNQILSFLFKKLFFVLCSLSYIYFFESLPFPLLTVRHIYEISEMTTHERRTIVTRPRSLMNFALRIALRCVHIFPGVNSRAELVTLA